jgi:hypothetical protein
VDLSRDRDQAAARSRPERLVAGSVLVVPALFDQFSDLLPTNSNWVLAVAWAVHIPWFWGLVEMFIVPGTSGDNRFGPDPLAVLEDGSAPAPSTKSWDQQSEIEFVPPSASPPGGMHVKRGA